MGKRLTSFLVIVAALLLTLPTQAQTARKAAKKNVFQTGMVSKRDVLKAQALKQKEAKVAAFAEVKGEDALAIKRARKEADTTVGKPFAKWNWAAHATPKYVSTSGLEGKGMPMQALPSKLNKSVSLDVAQALMAKNVKRTAPKKVEADPDFATVTLTAGDVWGDGSGYQLLLDADATAYGSIIPETGALTTSGDAPEGLYDNFEYKIPENADGALSTQNIVINNSITIKIPEGTYDYVVPNPTPGDRLWVAQEGRGDDYLFEKGHVYEFSVALNGNNDKVTISVDGEAIDPRVTLPEGVELVEYTLSYEDASGNPGSGAAAVAVDGNDVYFQGFSKYLPDALIKGTKDGNTITFPANQFLGTYSGYDDYFYSGATFTYDEATDTYTAEGQVYSVLGSQYYDANYFNPVLKGIVEVAATPANPAITGLNNGDYGYYITFNVPNVDTDGNGLLASKLFFEIFTDIEQDVQPLTFTPATHTMLTEDMTIIPFGFTEGYDFYSTQIFLNDLYSSAWNKIGIKSIYTGGGETNETEIQWFDIKDYGGGEPVEPGEPVEVPYTGDFMVEGTMDAFSTLDANGDDNSWKWSETYGAYYNYSSTNSADDYLILPINLEAPKNYNITVTASAASASYPEKFEVKVGKEATVEGLNITAIGETTVNTNTDTDYEGSFTTDEAGTYYVAIHVTSPADMYRLYVKKIVIEAGADGTAPAAPENFTVTPVEDVLAANIALTAPTKSIEGADLAAGDIAKIEVLRDGNVIKTFEAPNPGDELSFTDDAEDLTIGTHKYQAISYAADGIGGKTEEVEVFLTATLTVPYIADFTVEGTFNAFQVINNNGDGKTWAWNSSNFAYYGYDSTNDADDYLVTSPILLEAGKNYNVIVNARASGYNERFEVLVGKTADADGLNITAIGPTELTGSEFAEIESTFTVDEDGKYFVAIHAISDADQYNLCVRKLTIEKGAEPTAPAAVTNFSATAGEEGALEVNISYSAPVNAVDGSELTGNVDVNIYRDDAVINTTSVPVGSVQTYKDTNVEDGKTYTYYIVAANESGNGLKSEKVSVFVGHDALGTVENFEVASSTATTITFNWDEVAGLNGGYVDASGVEYSIYTLAIETDPDWGFQYLVADEKLSSVTGETEATVDFNVDEGEQQYKYFGISTKTATAEETDPASVYTYLIVGAPEELPIEEGFTGQSFHYLWNSNAASLSVSEDATDGDGVALALLSDEENQTVYFQLDKVNLQGAANPCIIFDVKSDAISSVRVYASADGGEKTVLQTVNVSGEYTTVKVPLTGINGERYSTVGFEADFANPSVFNIFGSIDEYGDILLVDNIKIMDLLEYNLVADITAPKSVVAGKEAKVKISLRNMGDNTAEGYNVKLFAGDEEIELDNEFAAIESFGSADIEAVYAPTIFAEAGTVTLRAEVEYELDLDDDDNVVETEIEVTEPAAPAPESLTATADGQKALLEWTVAEGEGVQSFTEGFDDQEVYPEFDVAGLGAEVHTGNLGEWTIVDGNNGLYSYGFDGLEVPNLGAQNAWIVMNPSSSQLAQDLSANYGANSPEQYMMSSCVAEPEGAIDATDHWLISPELPGVAQTITFQQRILVDSYGAETFEVLASSTDTEVASFTKVADFSKSNTTWEEVTADLPEGTKYFAIRHTSTDVWGLMIDDVTYMIGGGEITAFNIYVDEVLVGSVEGGVLTFTTDVLPEGEHKVSVTALYGETESRPIDATVTISAPTAIEEVINVDKLVDIFTVDGKLVRHNANSVKDLKPGVYVIDNQKVTVK